MLDLIKENILQEKKWNSDLINILHDQIEYVKNDIVHVN